MDRFLIQGNLTENENNEHGPSFQLKRKNPPITDVIVRKTVFHFMKLDKASPLLRAPRRE